MLESRKYKQLGIIKFKTNFSDKTIENTKWLLVNSTSTSTRTNTKCLMMDKHANLEYLFRYFRQINNFVCNNNGIGM